MEVLKKQVDETKTKEEMQKIFAKAQAKNTEDTVSEAVNSAVKTIQSLSALTSEQKEMYIRKLKGRHHLSEVNQIVAESKAINKK